MRYVEAKLEQGEIDSAYRFFVTEGIKAITKNTVGGEERTAFNIGYSQWLENRRQPEVTTTADEIIDSIKSKLEFLGG